jgi:hypothetical protein
MAEHNRHNPDDTAEAPDSAMGAGDASSGGGAGAGIPDAETAERAGEAVNRGDVAHDRKKLFPEQAESSEQFRQSKQPEQPRRSSDGSATRGCYNWAACPIDAESF